MYTNFTLKNFRVFDNEGACVPLRPITILTGCNNSGKSSIAKALCLLKDFCDQLESDFNDGKRLRLNQYKMDFQKSPNSVLGSFDLVRHQPSKKELKQPEELESTNNECVIFELVVESSWLLQDVILHLEFGKIESDDLNNGYLHSYHIRTLDGKVIYQSSRDGKASIDFSTVKKSFLHFLYGQNASSQWQNQALYLQMEGIGIDDDDMFANKFDKCMENLYNELGSTAYITLLEWQVSHCRRHWRDGVSGPANSVLKVPVDTSHSVNSPALDVYCYFPCLEMFKDKDKGSVIMEIEEKCQSLDDVIEKRVISLFMAAFIVSEAKSLHEFISQEENEHLFIKSNFTSLGGSFPEYRCSWWRHIHQYINDENDLPQKAEWWTIVWAMDIIDKQTCESKQNYVVLDNMNGSFYYRRENDLDDYMKSFLEDIFVNILPGSVLYSPTTIIRPQRLYALEDGSDFSNSLKQYFEAKRLWDENKSHKSINSRNSTSNEEHDYQPCGFINKWFSELLLGHHVEMKLHAGGYGVTILLNESEEDKIGMALADKGLGVLQLFATLLKIEIAIMNSMTNEKLYSYYTTGLSEDIIKYFRTYNQLHPATVVLEEPECHLHPSLQSKFADIMVDAFQKYGIHFLIESHSEYLIRKLQLHVSQKVVENTDISLLYVNSPSRPSYLPLITDIGIDADGTLKNEFGKGFYDESVRLSKELFKTKKEDDEN